MMAFECKHMMIQAMILRQRKDFKALNLIKLHPDMVVSGAEMIFLLVLFSCY